MRFLTTPQTIAEARHRKFPAYEVFAVTAGVVAAGAVGGSAALATGVVVGGAVLAAEGTAYSAYSSSQAQAANARLGRASARAQGQIASYQNELNYKLAMAQSQMHENNAKVLHNYARSQEVQGNEQINRSYQQEDAANSQVEAAYGASGIAADTGSPLMVEAHNAGIAQLSRMDQAYKTNLSALDTDWKGKMETYQSQVQAELAKQYQYGASVANWQGGAMADAAYSNAMTAANDTAISGYISATGSLLSSAGMFMMPSTTGGGKFHSVGSDVYMDDPNKMMSVRVFQGGR
jgi:hypothetical protein